MKPKLGDKYSGSGPLAVTKWAKSSLSVKGEGTFNDYVSFFNRFLAKLFLKVSSIGNRAAATKPPEKPLL